VRQGMAISIPSKLASGLVADGTENVLSKHGKIGLGRFYFFQLCWPCLVGGG
jgi:hypothetical protein